MERTNIKKRLLYIINLILKNKTDIKKSGDKFCYYFESIDYVNMVINIEKMFDIQFGIDELKIDKINSLDKLIDIVERLCEEKGEK